MTPIDIEQAVFDLVEEYNGLSLFGFRRRLLTLDTDFNADMKLRPVAARNLLDTYFARFQVDPGRFNFTLRLRRRRPPRLTLRMLAESARAGRWLYD